METSSTNRLMFVIFLLLMFSYIGHAQPNFMFVNYAPGASKGEGDNNYIQVINIKLPNGYSGKAFLRLFDMSCGSKNDIVLDYWNSTFKFSIYQGEFKEKDFLAVRNYKAQINEFLLSHFDIGKDPRYYEQWYTFLDLTKKPSEDLTFSFVVEGVTGDDGNRFNLLVSSDSLSNQPIAGVKYYTDEATIALRSSSKKISFKIMPIREDNQLTVHSFDMDGTKTYFSTLIVDETPIGETSNDQWNVSTYTLTEYENQNTCSFDIGPEYHEDNDVTFYFTSKSGERIPFLLEPETKLSSTIPSIVKNINYDSCNECSIDVGESYSGGGAKLSYQYKFEDGFISSDPMIRRQFEKPGTYNGEVLILDSESIAVTRAKLEKLKIVINEKPVAVSNENIIASPEEKILFDASRSFDNDGKIKNYFWEFGDGATGIGNKTSHSFMQPGIYKVILKVEDDYFNGECNSSLDTTNVIINSSPIIVAESQIIGSINQTLIFDASKSKDDDGTITKYFWDFGSNEIVEGAKVEKSFSLSGKFTVVLTVHDDSPASNNKTRKTVTVIINDPPKADAGKDMSVAQAERVLLDASISSDKDGKLIKYIWDFGNGISKEGKEIYHSFSDAGKYIVRLTVRDDSNTDSEFNSDSILVIVNDSPIASIENERFLNEGIASFDGSKSSTGVGEITQWIWDFGDGTTSEGKTTKHIYYVPGKYKTILKVIDNIKTKNNFGYDTSYVIVNRRPISDPGPDRIISVNQKIKFDGSNSIDPDGNITRYRWFINQKLISEEKIFENIFSEPGIYNVVLEVTDDFTHPQTSVSSLEVKVNSAPITVVEFNKVAAPNQKIKFDGSKSYDVDGVIKDYTWKFGDGTTAKGGSIEKAFDKPGIYNVVLILRDDSGVENSISSDTSIIRVNSSPVIKVNEIINTCENVITLDATKSIDPDGDDLTFNWEFPNKKVLKAGSLLSYKLDEYGLIPVTLTVDDGLGLQNSITITNINVNFHKPPVANAGSDTTVCAGDIVIFNGLKSTSAGNGILNYEWTFDDSVTLYGSNVYRIFKKGGTYSVLLRVKDDSGLDCDEAWDSKIIQVIDAPIAVAGDDITACANKAIHFDGTKSTSPGGIVNSYNWDFGDGETGVGPNPVHIYEKTGSYKVTLTITGEVKGNCDNTAIDDLTVTVSDAPIAKILCGEIAPVNSEITFDASLSETYSGNIKSYEWNFGDGTTAAGKVVKHNYVHHGTYNVQLYISTDLTTECNSAFASKQVIINSSPVAKIKCKRKGGVNETIAFDGSLSSDIDGKIFEYNWDFGDGQSTDGIIVAHQYSKSGNYKVTLTVIDNSGAANNSATDFNELCINESPVADFEIPESALINSKIILDATNSIDSDGKIKSYVWYVNDIKVSDQSTTTVLMKQIGLNKVRLVVSDDSDQLNSADEITKYIIVNEYPRISLPKRIMGCVDEEIEINPMGELNRYNDNFIFTWLLKETAEQSKLSVFHKTFTGGGNYTLQLVVHDLNNNVVKKDSTLISINQSPILPDYSDVDATIGYVNDEILFDATKTIDPDNDFVHFRWNLGDGKYSDQSRVYHKYEKEGKYLVTIEADDQKKLGCSKTFKRFFITVRKVSK